jgi:amidase
MTPFGVGTDYGGSVRVPAQFCGVCSLRTTLGRVASATALAPEDFPIGRQLMMVLGPMARRVSDLRLALEHMCGEDPRDPWWTPAPLGGPRLSRRVSVLRAADDPAVAGAIDAAASALEDAGYEIDDVEPPMVDDAARFFWTLAACEIRFRLTTLRPLFGADALRFLETVFEMTPDLDRAGYIEGLQARQGIARAWGRFQGERPLILSPAATRPPFPVGRDLEGPVHVGELIESMRCAVTINLLGLPAVAVPVGVSDGLPRGVQLIGPRYREDLCLDAAEALEHRLGIITPINPT